MAFLEAEAAVYSSSCKEYAAKKNLQSAIEANRLQMLLCGYAKEAAHRGKILWYTMSEVAVDQQG